MWDFPAIHGWLQEGSNCLPFTKKKHSSVREWERSPTWGSKYGEVFTSIPIWNQYEPVVSYQVMCNLLCSMQNTRKYRNLVALPKPETKNIQPSEFRRSCCTCEIGSNSEHVWYVLFNSFPARFHLDSSDSILKMEVSIMEVSWNRGTPISLIDGFSTNHPAIKGSMSTAILPGNMGSLLWPISTTGESPSIHCLF